MQLEEALLQLRLGELFHLVVAEKLQEEQHGVGHGKAGGQLLGALVPVEGGELGVEAEELPALVLCPELLRSFAYRLLKPGKPARPTEPEVIDLRQLVEIYVLVIYIAGL